MMIRFSSISLSGWGRGAFTRLSSESEEWMEWQTEHNKPQPNSTGSQKPENCINLLPWFKRRRTQLSMLFMVISILFLSLQTNTPFFGRLTVSSINQALTEGQQMSSTLWQQLGDPPPEPHTSLSSIDQEMHRGRGWILRWAALCFYGFISCGACACAHASALVLKDLGSRLALIHKVGPVIMLAQIRTNPLL